MSERDRRALVAGGIAAALVIGAWMLLRATGDEGPGDDRDSAAQLYVRYRQLADQRETTRAALERGRREEALLLRRLLPQSDPDLAGAALTAMVEEIGERSNVELERRLLQEPETIDGALQAIPLRLTMAGDILGLRLFLYELARSERTLVVRELKIASTRTTGGNVGTGRQAPLRLELTVVGYTLLPTEEPAS